MSLDEAFAKAAANRLGITLSLTCSGYTAEVFADTPAGHLSGGLLQAPRFTPLSRVAELVLIDVHEVVAAATVARNRAKKVKVANG